jgi:acetolactate synthase-1/2/3 large subunit
LGATTILQDASLFVIAFQAAFGLANNSLASLNKRWLPHLQSLLALENEMLIKAGKRGETPYLNSHGAVANLLAQVADTDILVIDGGGTALYSGFQAAPLERFRNVVSLNAISSMGTAPGQMIGALEAQPKDRVIGIIGDGSFVMALNALPSISSNSNAFLIVITNGGYLAIRHTQERFLGSRFDGTWNPGKNDLPSVRKISESLGFRYFEYSMESSPPVKEMLNPRITPNAATVIEVYTDPSQEPFWSVDSEIDHRTGKPVPLPLSIMTNGFGAIDA